MVEIRSLTTMHMILMVGYLMVEYLIFFTISIWIIDYNAHDFNPNNWIHGLEDWQVIRVPKPTVKWCVIVFTYKSVHEFWMLVEQRKLSRLTQKSPRETLLIVISSYVYHILWIPI